MNECICSQCKNLKSTIDETDENANSIVEVCEFDFPSADCLTCELDGCDLKCDHFERDEIEEKLLVVQCSICQKQLSVVSVDPDRAVFCIECYLKK